MSIPVGASGAQAEIPFECVDGDGNPVEVTNWTSHTVQVRLPGGTFAGATKANIVSWGPAGVNHRGRYALQLTAGESVTAGQASIYVAAGAGEFRTYWGDETIEPLASVDATAVANAILDAVLRTGWTIRGYFRKAYAWHFGKVTGMPTSAAPTMVTAYQPDGSTVEFTTVMDPGAGTRQISSPEV